MTSLVLQVAGGALGGLLGGPFGAMAGRMAGAVAGATMDRALFGGSASVTGPRLDSLAVQGSSEGGGIPRVYGRARISGQVIWATAFEEETSTTRQGAKGIGGGTSTTYTYYANFAVALCEGPIAHIGRIWADGELLDMEGLNVRIYMGDEAQLPDALIQAREGRLDVPAYRGLAYVVFERLPIAPFGNRLPQLSFEVIRPVGDLEQQIGGVCIIPGASEFGYATTKVFRDAGYGTSVSENRHLAMQGTDWTASIDELQAVCQNLSRAALIVSWFGDDLRAGHCRIRPGVDAVAKATTGQQWQVAGLSRSAAHAVSRIDGAAASGGTPSDASVIEALRDLKTRGLAVSYVPFILMDIAPDNTLPDPWTGNAGQPAYPWRGRITSAIAAGRAGSTDGTSAILSEIDAFFGTATPANFTLAGERVVYSGPDEWGYRRHILHAAMLCKAAGGVDTFLIGTELRGLTRLRSSRRTYPVVERLVALAADVKAILGAATKVSYAADWTEYGAYTPPDYTGDVLFPLDALWASPDIDFVGLDAYAPLADWRDGETHADAASATPYDRDYLAANIAGGEAYDWYYADDAARLSQTRLSITDGAYAKPWVYRPKDIANWWLHPHVERLDGVEVSAPTQWQAGLKPVRFTEVGVPAVDKGANQPNLFPDPLSSEGGVPLGSSGARDDLVQRRALEVFLAYWDPAHPQAATRNPVSPHDGRRMVDATTAHLWCWDARPWPAFPALDDVWGDGPRWHTGHWLNGRLGAAPLDRLVAALAEEFGPLPVEVSGLDAMATGYVVDRAMAGRSAIEPLLDLYGVRVHEASGVLVFSNRPHPPQALSPQMLVQEDKTALLELTRTQESELPRSVSVSFVDPGADFRRKAVVATRFDTASNRETGIDTALIVHPSMARGQGAMRLHEAWAGRETMRFAVPLSQLALEVDDVLALDVDGSGVVARITKIEDGACRRIEAKLVDPTLNLPFEGAFDGFDMKAGAVSGAPFVVVLDLPPMPDDARPHRPRVAISASPWAGAYVVRSRTGMVLARVSQCATLGELAADLPAGPVWRFDRHSVLLVRLAHGVLASVPEEDVLAGANSAALRHADGAWEVVQFATAELVGPGEYRLTGLLRGQCGTEALAAQPLASGALFVVLDRALQPLELGIGDMRREQSLTVLAEGRSLNDASRLVQDFAPTGIGLLPLSPVHPVARRSAEGITISFQRRTRSSGDAWELADVPLGEEQSLYEVEIRAGATLKRVLSTALTSVLYPAAQELADFGTPQQMLDLVTVQLSPTAGRGAPCVMSVPVWTGA